MDDQFLILGRILIALLLGGIIGLERELDNKPAGLRTHILAAMSTALLVSLVPRVVSEFDVVNPTAFRYDPLRLLEAIVVGISFLGAGTIIKGGEGREVHNLTTAASILMTGMIGFAIGLDYLIVAVGTTVIVVIVTWLLGRLEERYIEQEAR